jgi:hypothetical protein
VVGFVEYGDLDGVQPHMTGVEVVAEAAGAGDQHVNPSAQARDLRLVPDPSEDHHRAQRHRCGQRRHCPVDLGGELAGRRKDQRARPPRAAGGRAGGEPGQQRKNERERLARAGLTPAEHITPGQRIGQRRGLDRKRRGDAVGCEHRRQRGGHAELCEGGRRHRRGHGRESPYTLGMRRAPGVGSGAVLGSGP